MPPRLLIVTGARAWPSRDRIAAEIAAYPPAAYELMHGACPRGADALADEVARPAGYVIHAWPADWTRHGNAAGPIRNAAMTEEAADGIAARRWSSVQGLAFGALTKPDGRDTGTGGMVKLLRARGWPVRHVAMPEAEALTIALEVWTARIDGQPRDPDDLDITRAGSDAIRKALRLPEHMPTPGGFLAPSWAILRPALDARKLGGEAFARAWRVYVDAFTAEMRRSYRERRDEWTWLLARPRVVLRCHCRGAERCHRRLVSGMLCKLGAVVRGELPAAPQRQGRLPWLE